MYSLSVSVIRDIVIFYYNIFLFLNLVHFRFSIFDATILKPKISVKPNAQFPAASFQVLVLSPDSHSIAQ